MYKIKLHNLNKKTNIYVVKMSLQLGLDNIIIGDFAKVFIGDLKKSGLISEISREVFLEFVIAVRFAWLSEWLRHKDREMIDLETVYMNLLAYNSDMLKNVW